jgi:hypothetical protein
VADENGRADRNRDNRKGILNGSSLSALAGAEPSAKTLIEVRYPASSMAEVFDAIHRLGYTGSLQVNFQNGKARDLKWAATRETKPPDGV